MAYIGLDGEIYLVGQDLSVRCISRAARDLASATSPDIVWVPPSSTTNGMLLARATTGWRVLDTEAGHWGQWTFATDPAYMAGINGVPWGQVSAAPTIVSVDATGGTDLGVNFTQAVQTGILSPEGQTPASWGRVQGMTVLAKVAAASYSLGAKLYADEAETVILNKSATVSTTVPTNWPRSQRPQFGTTQQRCQFVSARIEATPAIVTWNAIDLWVAGTRERAPSRNRS